MCSIIMFNLKVSKRKENTSFKQKRLFRLFLKLSRIDRSQSQKNLGQFLKTFFMYLLITFNYEVSKSEETFSYKTFCFDISSNYVESTDHICVHLFFKSRNNANCITGLCVSFLWRGNVNWWSCVCLFFNSRKKVNWRTKRHTDGQSGRQMDKETDRLTKTQTGQRDREMDKEIDTATGEIVLNIRAHTQTHINTHKR